MASTELMDDSFRVRVEKIFGSLAPPGSRSSSSPWSLTDDEVERRRWKLDEKDTSARDETPCSSSFDDFLKKDRRQRSFRDDVDGDDRDRDRDRDRNEWEIRSSIGLDSTLDNEEEEDEFDKVASGRENAGERLYMNDVTDRGSYLNMHNVLPNSLNGAAKDPRANRHAARIRLKEDEAEAKKINSALPDCDTEVKESLARVAEDSGQLKSILKRKDNSADSMPQKRVRFNPGCELDCEEASEKFEYSSINTLLMNSTNTNHGFQLAKNVSRIPDYVLNPSKYTHYSLNASSELNEESNIKTYMDFLMVTKSSMAKDVGSELENAFGNHPKSVTFIPKKKASDVKVVNIHGEIKEKKQDDGREFLPQVGFPVCIAVGESRHCEISAFDEIEPETNAIDDFTHVNKPSRNYRTQSKSNDSDF